MYLYRNDEQLEEVGYDQHFLTVRYTEAAVSFVRESAEANAPFFLYLAYSMPHLPVMTVPEREGRSRAGLYGDVIETLDWSAGRILGELKARGIEKDTLVVFTSDNGPWQNLPDRMLAGGNERWHSGLSGHMKGAKKSSHEGGPRVPAIIRWPGVIPAGRVSAEIASTIDFLPTFAGLAGVRIPEGHQLDGHDLLPFLKGQSASPRTEYLFSVGRFFDAVRQGPWKYRLVDGPELYHLGRDPSERYNVVERYSDIAARLRERLIEAAESYGAKIRE